MTWKRLVELGLVLIRAALAKWNCALERVFSRQ
jgi:hypothetical protein